MDNATFFALLGWIVGVAVVLGLQFFIIRYAVLGALRAHRAEVAEAEREPTSPSSRADFERRARAAGLLD
ncbi:hypothetical protein [Agromyces laixinhei]|uniref:hypothetical protein n=1 Tax=Agromyces laixinhei TaxID=2585717 RepID=UPI0012ECF582|nr:hypothetical protein [Agromyces laixinhei]